jgi:hypothetical protein
VDDFKEMWRDEVGMFPIFVSCVIWLEETDVLPDLFRITSV